MRKIWDKEKDPKDGKYTSYNPQEGELQNKNSIITKPWICAC